ncbi:hypothetical protein FIBSPDRAFT_92305 [Athelia psychrophila]|uniref:Golgi apparatus membrane protein TVP38 n=1 Tax=Athelia psychrophila TaxID=1759441 RepID=A0A166TKB7_9AGAM|nr:hypothetical protein FIBSPDRAFT_92305 [Fibularhizoctonia sp. CBS 109695]
MSSNPANYQQSPAPAYPNAQHPQYQPPYRQVQQQLPTPHRGLNRTPSPTPSEAKMLGGGRSFDLRESLKPKRENIVFIIFFVLILTVLIVFAALHNKIIDALKPELDWVHNLKDGWLIPLAIIIVLSFPPLFGSEFISVLCGVIYGPGIGFAIAGSGILIGELLNYFTFKYMCKGRSEKLKKTNVRYACLGRVIQEGGLPVAVVARYSIIPSHVTTALFATCGLKLWVFVASAIASLPKNFVSVYIGSTFAADAAGTGSKKSKLINAIVVVVTIFITMFAMRFIDSRINAVKQEVIYERRKARADGQASSSDISLGAMQSQNMRDTSNNV